jgi:hypothetical protein
MTTETVHAPPALAAAGGRPEAAAAAWDRRRGEASPQAGEPPPRLRRRALVEAAVGAAAGALLYLWRPAVAGVAWSLAALVLAAALASPTLVYAGFRRAVAWLGHAVGQLLTVVLLVPVFLGFFALGGGLFRRGRRNRMERRFDRAAPTYWKRRPEGERTLADYERMF